MLTPRSVVFVTYLRIIPMMRRVQVIASAIAIRRKRRRGDTGAPRLGVQVLQLARVG
jgi:hypothetical protein